MVALFQFFRHRDLARGLNQKESWALNEVFKKYSRRMLLLARGIVKNRENAQDIVTDSFLKLYDTKQQFSGLAQLEGYLKGIVRNTAIDFLRQQQKIFEAMAYSDIGDLPVSGTNIEEAEQRALFIALIDAEIQKLPKKCRTICMLYFREGLADDEIARRLGISEKTVRNQKSIVVKLLRMPILTMKKTSILLLISLYNYSVFCA